MLKKNFYLGSVLEYEGLNKGDTNDIRTLLKPPHQSSDSSLGTLERKKALTQLASLISQFRSSSDSPDEPAAFRLEELPNILQILAELAVEAKKIINTGKRKKRCFMLLRQCYVVYCTRRMPVTIGSLA